MDKIVEAILKLQPFGKLFKWLGLNDDWSALFSVILIVLILMLLSKFTKFLLERYKSGKQALGNIKPQFDHLSIKKAKKFYIQTQYQNASPSRQEEPGFTHKYIARNKLIPFFIKTAFNEKSDSERFYLILADSGMGKTTFMINLYLRYYSFFSHPRNYKMKLFRFSNPDTISQVKSIHVEEAKETILLLDALDEDQGIISKDPTISDAKAFQNRIDEIIELTKNFREVLITCRTQYFPGQEEDPYELKIKRPDERGFYTLNKLYISPFNEKEVKKYLSKKFGIVPFINRKKKNRALKVVSKSKNLVMRPMLLSYIDYLIEDEFTNITTHNIYDTLVSKWLNREAEKRKGLADKDEFIENLRSLSYKTAIAIYTNWRKYGRMYLSKEEALKIAREFTIDLKPEEITGQSLLTCDGVGNWKFAHKSILEFFLANEVYKNPRYLKKINFAGMDMARKFYEELNPRLIFIDQSINNIQGEVSEFYIYHSFIKRTELLELVYNEGEMSRKFTISSNCTLELAIGFCNKINIRNGYSPAYDGEYNFLDSNGSITTNIEKVRGFRLPTKTELQRYLANRLYKNYFRFDDRTKEHFEFTNTSIIVENIGGTDSKIFGNKEWSHDKAGISVVELPKSITIYRPIDIPDILESSVKSYPTRFAGGNEFPFRLVFVP